MIRRIFSLTLLILILSSVTAQVELSKAAILAKLSRSIVWVEVKDIPGKDNNVCSGFVWQQPNHVVTSLHAMNPEGKVWVKYFNNARYLREAKVKKVLKHADLVLLEVLPGDLGIPPEVVPITSMDTNFITAGTPIYALGFPGGAPQSRGITLEKGYMAPKKFSPELSDEIQEEKIVTLNKLLPPQYSESLSIPSTDLKIIYLEGSLLPGFSGSPTADPYGRLIGIGDGGLENGASHLSWVIPASFLIELENKGETELPFGLASSAMHYNTTIPASPGGSEPDIEESPELAEKPSEPTGEALAASQEPAITGNTDSNEQEDSGASGLEAAELAAADTGKLAETTEVSEVPVESMPELTGETIIQPNELVDVFPQSDSTLISDTYGPVVSPDFEFYLTKNRSLMEMFETSENPENIVKFISGMKEVFKLNMDYENLRFDIYEDINHGVVLGVPGGEVLYYHEKDKHFQLNKTENTNVHLLFKGVADDFSKTTIEDQLDATFEWLLDTMNVYWKVKNFSIDKDYTYLLPYDKERKIAYVLMKSEPVMDMQYGGFSTIYLYVTLLMTDEKTFISIASYSMADEKLKAAQQNGLDCLNKEIINDDCEYFEALIKVFCAAHLTTFATRPKP